MLCMHVSGFRLIGYSWFEATVLTTLLADLYLIITILIVDRPFAKSTWTVIWHGL